MNAQKFTKKSLEALQSAESIAIENQNMQVMPEHLAYALVDQDGGLIPSLMKKAGIDVDKLLAMLDGVVTNLVHFFVFNEEESIFSVNKKTFINTVMECMRD